MSFDIAAFFGTVTRTVADRTIDGQPAKAVLLSKIYDTDTADLWSALTDGERIRRWFLPVSGDLRLGGRYQFEGNAGGTITTCEPERRLAATWEFGGGTSWVTITLAPEGNGTRLELEHLAPVMPEFDAQYGPGAVGVGWDLGLLGLAQYIVAPAEYVLPPEEREAWAKSSEAMDLYRRSSAAWGQAAIASGTSPDAARAAAERTRAFYSGEPG